jgi:hypothetical protein
MKGGAHEGGGHACLHQTAFHFSMHWRAILTLPRSACLVLCSHCSDEIYSRSSHSEHHPAAAPGMCFPVCCLLAPLMALDMAG